MSGDLAEIVKVILKTSHNPGADLMACLDAVASGSKDCEHGLVTVQQYVSKDLGVDPTVVLPLRRRRQRRPRPVGGDRLRPPSCGPSTRSPTPRPFEAALPILGVDGDLANQGLGTPAVGHVLQQDRHAERPSSRPASASSNARTQVGYIDAASGRKLVFSIMVADVPFDPVNIDDLLQVIADVANLSVAIYEAY